MGSILLIALVGGIWILFLKVSSANRLDVEKSQRPPSSAISPNAISQGAMKTPIVQARRSALTSEVLSSPTDEVVVGGPARTKSLGRLWSQELGTQPGNSGGSNHREAWQDAGASVFAEHYHQLKPELIGAQASAL